VLFRVPVRAVVAALRAAVAKTGAEAAASPLYAQALPVAAAALLASEQADQVFSVAQAALRVAAAEVHVFPVTAQVFRRAYLSLPAHVFQDAQEEKSAQSERGSQRAGLLPLATAVRRAAHASASLLCAQVLRSHPGTQAGDLLLLARTGERDALNARVKECCCESFDLCPCLPQWVVVSPGERVARLPLCFDRQGHQFHSQRLARRRAEHAR
jgi:hypothetical protein